MADTSLLHAPAIADGGQDALELPDFLGALNMHDKEDSHETSDPHDMKLSIEKKNPIGSFFAIVSFGLSRHVLYPSLILW